MSSYPTAHPQVHATIHGTSTCVLIADDHEDSREALKALLEAFGYTVVLATNGAEAVERARQARPHLILMDVMMPRLDGLSATRLIRADPTIPQAPIVAVTAMDDAGDRMLSAGCDDFLVKPIDIRAFIGRVPEWLALDRTGRTMPVPLPEIGC